jgi:hypothetical protein
MTKNTDNYQNDIDCGDGSTLTAFDEYDEQVIRHLVAWDKATLIEWCIDHGVEEQLADVACAAEERRREQ